jgi:hypothetical protein
MDFASSADLENATLSEYALEGYMVFKQVGKTSCDAVLDLPQNYVRQ